MDHRRYNPDRFTRKSLRLPHRDYSAAGAYFVTIRALPPDPLFEIPKLRYILLQVWQDLPKRFAHVRLDEFVIMPDHVHFILWLDGTRGKNLTLGSVVGVYKSLTTVLWLQHLKSVGKDMRYSCRIWQEGYYDRVVRVDELEQTRQYIRDNPTKGRQEGVGESS
jgi:putative transposase